MMDLQANRNNIKQDFCVFLFFFFAETSYNSTEMLYFLPIKFFLLQLYYLCTNSKHILATILEKICKLLFLNINKNREE